MKTVSKRTLVMLAASVWYMGAIMLLIKGSILLATAGKLEPQLPWHWLAAITGVLFGIIKAKKRFRHACQKNLARIATLPAPKLWQVFRPVFFLALAVMITAGVTLSHIAQGNYILLVAVGLLELSISVALFGSSNLFWSYRRDYEHNHANQAQESATPNNIARIGKETEL
jgi:hypothetical protein